MSKYRRAARIDDNQNAIVNELRKMGYSVQPGHDDILVGFKGKTFWFEIKKPETRSKKTGEILESAIKPTQKKLLSEWAGHYSIVSSIDEILRQINEHTKHIKRT